MSYNFLLNLIFFFNVFFLQIFDVTKITIIHKLLNENVCGFVDFALPTKPPSISNMPTSKELNVVVVMVQTSNHEGFAFPNQNVTTSNRLDLIQQLWEKYVKR